MKKIKKYRIKIDFYLTIALKSQSYWSAYTFLLNLGFIEWFLIV